MVSMGLITWLGVKIKEVDDMKHKNDVLFEKVRVVEEARKKI